MIGVLGASGRVGQGAVAALRRMGFTGLRLGARRIAALPPADGEAVRVDAADPESLAAFCRGCEIVLNCAGPSYRLKDTVAVAALEAGAHYVDVSGDDPALDGLRAKGLAGTERSVLLSAGTLPGLSSLIPRRLAADVGRPVSLTAYAGGMERCSPVVAVDMLLSLESGTSFGEPLAAWREGRARSRALRAQEKAEAPYFPGTVALQPFLSTETARLARDLRLDEAEWFNVWPGPRVWDVLNELPAYTLDGADRSGIAERMIRAADLDLAGRRPYYLMVVILRGEKGTRTAVLRAPDSYRLTGTVGALAVEAVADGRTPPGAHFAAGALDPADLLERVRASETVDSLTVHDGEPDSEEGVL
ncbi:hypothetical protein HNP84_005192 [Thermocatellispora tengchongensis]|uniref:Saccharopine dehydrogenase NADP binding domain-containing protein n=1 Tax=Thermocatellispora tengchongensis TaxID=1073253 RepID=A0A840P703_9ACTN|nr:saccharopine dehydrogenase NADP-binding domain-containing protein [Thermocatellispora tengchongensis]MBB5135448.1 hypothetical protein [Thermocatellispora tengchongensis]